MSHFASTRTLRVMLMAAAPLLAAFYWPMTSDDEVDDGIEAFADGRFEVAVERFRSALDGEGDKATIAFNLGTALLLQAQSAADGSDLLAAEAMQFLETASMSVSEPLRIDALYNLATARALYGDLQGGIEALKDVLRRRPDHANARYNLELMHLAALSPIGAKGLLSLPQPVRGDIMEQVADAGVPAMDAGQVPPREVIRPRFEGRDGERDLPMADKLEALERRSSELRLLRIRKLSESRARMDAVQEEPARNPGSPAADGGVR